MPPKRERCRLRWPTAYDSHRDLGAPRWERVTTLGGLVDLGAERLRLRRLRQHPHLSALLDLAANRPPDLFQHQQHLRVLLLGQEVQLQVEVTALVADLGSPVLTHQDEDREKDRLH